MMMMMMIMIWWWYAAAAAAADDDDDNANDVSDMVGESNIDSHKKHGSETLCYPSNQHKRDWHANIYDVIPGILGD